jgi:hypothetical protein
MPTVNNLIRQHLLKDIPERIPLYLERTEFSSEFDRLRMNRKMCGAFRYGLLGDLEKPEYDRISDMILRLEKYKNDLNKEHLIDVANICECEFVEGRGTLKAQADGEHTNPL